MVDPPLFAFRIAHASHPNRSADRRIGMAIRYIPPHVTQTLADWDSAALVRGEDRYGRFEHEPEPARDFDPVWPEATRRPAIVLFDGHGDVAWSHVGARIGDYPAIDQVLSALGRVA